MKKRVLLVISIIVILMGVMSFIPSIKLGTEPTWHAAVKLVVGLVGLWVSLQKTGKTKTALLVIGILLAAMGLVDVLGLLRAWHRTRVALHRQDRDRRSCHLPRRYQPQRGLSSQHN